MRALKNIGIINRKTECYMSCLYVITLSKLKRTFFMPQEEEKNNNYNNFLKYEHNYIQNVFTIKYSLFYDFFLKKKFFNCMLFSSISESMLKRTHQFLKKSVIVCKLLQQKRWEYS